MTISRSVRCAAAVLAFTVMPGTALAADVASDYARGEQHVTRRYGNGADLSGSLEVTRSNTGAYFRGLVDWGKGWCSNTDIGRYTPIVSSGQGRRNVGGTVTAMPGPTCSGNAKPKVSICKDVDRLPDPCGAWTGRL